MFQDNFFQSQTLITSRRVDKENALSTQRSQKSFNKPTVSTRKALGDLTNGSVKAPNPKKKTELVVKPSQPVQKKTVGLFFFF